MIERANITAELSIHIEKRIDINAPLEAAFSAILEQIGPLNVTPDGNVLSMKIEPWPGGRWYRDLGDDNGHLWGHVQAINRPTLLEITGPLFMSYAVVSNVQYRLKKDGSKTLLSFRHTAFGLLEKEHREGLSTGWGFMLERVRNQAEARGGKD